MANKVVIDVEARFIDNLSGETKGASKAIEDVGKEADQAKKKVENLGKAKAKPTFDADDSKLLRKLKAAEAKAAKFGRTKSEMVLSVIDRASSVVLKVLNLARNFGGKIWRGFISLKDSNAYSTIKKITNAAEGFTRKTWTAIVKVKDLATSPLRAIKNSLFSIKTLIAAIGTAWATSKLVLNPINIADAYSSTKIGFSTLLGNEEGQAMMDAMDEFAKKTPFKTSGVIDNAQKMMAYGWDASRILEDMETIGNAAAATGKMDEGLASIVYALSEIRSKGKLSTQELNQLASAGIKAKQYLAQGLGYGTSDEGLMKLAEDLESGAIGANQAIELILEGMKEFDGMMDRTANETVEGLKSQIADAFEISIFRRWGQGLQDGAKRGLGSVVSLLDRAQEGLDNLGNMMYEVGKTASNWLADKLEGAVSMITALSETEEFKNASLGGKVKILWDGVVANPIKEWWDNGGQKKTAETAGKIGSWLGETLTKGFLMLFGATDILSEEDGEKQGMTVAQSFLDGFLANFDGSAITDAFVSAFKNVWGALPTWAKILLGGYAGAKAFTGIANLASGVGRFFGSTGTVAAGGTVANASGLLGMIGKTGQSGVGSSGLLGLLANAGYKFMGGTSALSMTGGQAALAGGGLAVGGVTALSGAYDLYKGYKNDDSTSKKAGAWKVGGAGVGAGVGAGLGALVGSFLLPGVGTAAGAKVGALLGTTVGSGIGWWQSNKAKKEAAEAAAESSEALEDLAQSESAAAEEAAKLIQKNKELAKTSLDKHFGDVTLSAEEMQSTIRKLIGEKFFKETEAAATAIDQMNASFSSFEAQNASLKKNIWLASLKKDVKLTESEINSLKDSVDSFSNSAKTYVTDAQYAATESISSIMGNSKEAEKLIDSTNKYYGEQSDKITKLTKSLNKEIDKAVSKDSEGGVTITANEKKSIEKLRSQINDIVRKIQEEEYEAEINILKAKYLGDMTPEGFGDLMAGAAEQNKTLAESYWDEFGRASVGKSDKEIKTLRKGTLDKLSNLWKNTGDLGIGTLREQYSKELGILGQDLSTMLEKNTPEAIMKAVNNLDDETRQGISKMMEYMQPTTDEVEKLVKAYENAGLKVPEALTSYLDTAEFYEALAKGPEAVEKYFQDKEIDIDPKIKPIDLSQHPIVVEQDLDRVFSIEANVETEWTYDEFDDEWISPDGNYSFSTDALVDAGWTYNEFEKQWISPDGKYTFSTNADVDVDFDNNKFDGSKANFGVKDIYHTNTTVSVDVKYKINGGITNLGNPKMSYASKQAQLFGGGGRARGGIVGGGSSAMESYATGGLVRGGGRLVRVAEEGTPEMIIPLGSQRRHRALKLWAKAGEMMDVPGFARGGLTNGSQDEGLRFHQYGSSETTGGEKTVQVDVGGITLEIHVNGTDPESIVEAIKAHVDDIADDVAGVLANALSAQFANTPVRGGVA